MYMSVITAGTISIKSDTGFGRVASLSTRRRGHPKLLSAHRSTIFNTFALPDFGGGVRMEPLFQLDFLLLTRKVRGRKSRKASTI